MAGRKAKIGFGYHLTAFLAVSAVLIWINMDMFPQRAWAQWPIIVWSIGLAFHGFSLVPSSQKQNQGFFYHLAAYMIINAFLIFTNITTTPDFLWFKYPLVIWTCIMAFHGWRIFPKYRRTNA
ncbi:MAG TPA: 2TM domain-containing protein [Smithella sp.]|nr:2TM domain-containing protein [Smithella sp.]MDM7987035.1 2TM domain-containing protein [Smithella sp.]HNY50127.1 2TM domain-containing protein [Smithella sp.]HOG89556.1 2TM domain-containing protein [Smithella sp.]HOU49892.1 2TM domain-containing protein [Smithella sp.]